MIRARQSLRKNRFVICCSAIVIIVSVLTVSITIAVTYFALQIALCVHANADHSLPPGDVVQKPLFVK